MAKPVECRIVGMPDGRFAVIAVLASGKVFRHAGLTSLAEAEESVGMLRDLMAACGAPVVVEVSNRLGTQVGVRVDQAVGSGRTLGLGPPWLSWNGTPNRIRRASLATTKAHPRGSSPARRSSAVSPGMAAHASR